MTVEAPSPPPHKSLDYGHSLECGYCLVPDAADPQSALEYEGRSVAATGRRLPDLQFSNQVADSDLVVEEDQQ
jgi:hypothetical protein